MQTAEDQMVVWIILLGVLVAILSFIFAIIVAIFEAIFTGISTVAFGFLSYTQNVRDLPFDIFDYTHGNIGVLGICAYFGVLLSPILGTLVIAHRRKPASQISILLGVLCLCVMPFLYPEHYAHLFKYLDGTLTITDRPGWYGWAGVLYLTVLMPSIGVMVATWVVIVVAVLSFLFVLATITEGAKLSRKLISEVVEFIQSVRENIALFSKWIREHKTFDNWQTDLSP